MIARLQQGLSLLPPPKEPQCGNLDQFNYPAPPSWYLQEVEEWEKKEAAANAATAGDGGVATGVKEAGQQQQPGAGELPGQGVVVGGVASTSQAVAALPGSSPDVGVATSGAAPHHAGGMAVCTQPTSAAAQATSVLVTPPTAPPTPLVVTPTSMTTPPTSLVTPPPTSQPAPPTTLTNLPITVVTPPTSLLTPPTGSADSDESPLRSGALLTVKGNEGAEKGVAYEVGGGGGEEDMDVCSLSPAPMDTSLTPVPEATPPPPNQRTGEQRSDVSPKASGVGTVGVATDGEGMASEKEGSDKPPIAKVNAQEQLIKLSEITRLQVYVAPVAAAELQKTLPTSTAQATPTQAPQIIAEPASATQDIAPPPSSGVVNTQSTLEAPLTAPQVSSDQPVATPTETAVEEEPAYSLRSKAKDSWQKGKRVAGKASFHPKVLSDSDSDVNYDDYLDQLEDEEEEVGEGQGAGPSRGSSAPELTLTDTLSKGFPTLGNGDVKSLDQQLSGDFPVTDSSSAGAAGGNKQETLQSLVGITSGECATNTHCY